MHAKFADRMATMYRRIDAGSLEAKRYSGMTRNRPFTLNGEPGFLGHYFNIYYGQRELHSKEWLDKGDALIVSSSGEYNGCYGFFEYDNLIKPPFATVPSTGSIGVGFVQRLPCGVTDDCLLLFPKSDTSDEALYIAAAVARLESWRFSYGRKITPARIARFKLPLSDTLLDWVKRRRKETAKVSREVVEAMADERGNEEEFKRLVRAMGSRAAAWRQCCRDDG